MLFAAAGVLLFKINHYLHLFLSETNLDSMSLRMGNKTSDSFLTGIADYCSFGIIKIRFIGVAKLCFNSRPRCIYFGENSCEKYGVIQGEKN